MTANHTKTLDLASAVIDRPLDHLSKVLQGTQVTNVVLCGNRIGDGGAVAFVVNLKDTQVTRVILWDNQISPEGADAIATHVPETLLTRVSLNFYSPVLFEALELNLRRLLITPYYVVALRFLPEAEKAKYFKLSEQNLESEEGRVRYAGGILMHSDLPEIIQEKILGYFPLMITKGVINQTPKYNRVLQKFHPEGLKIQDDTEIDKKLEKLKIS